MCLCVQIDHKEIANREKRTFETAVARVKAIQQQQRQRQQPNDNQLAKKDNGNHFFLGLVSMKCVKESNYMCDH